jgi:predicted  nucleic acid-binding Zn-ribbon protein
MANKNTTSKNATTESMNSESSSFKQTTEQTPNNKSQNAIYDSEKVVEWGGFLNEFLWVCAGVDRKVLRQCPTDYAKYAGIGGTILFTALMAMLSGGYALFTVFDSKFTAIGFGVFWGLLIFNLDRFIVNTMYSDGKVTISWREFYCGLPRIIMAIFLGIVISTPLELKIFEDAIDIRIEQDKSALLDDRVKGTVHERDSIANKRDEIMNGVTMFDTDITTSSTTTNNLLGEINELQDELNEVDGQISDLNKQIVPLKNKLKKLEPSDDNYSKTKQKLSSLKGKESSAIKRKNTLSAEIRKKQGEAAASDSNLKTLMQTKQAETSKESARLQHDVDSLNTIINNASIRHEDWSEQQIKEKGSFKDKLDVEYKGFQAKMNAFGELKDEDSSTKIASIFIMLLFIIIETAPTFFKMMIASGPYDDLLRAEMHRAKVLSEKRISDINDDVNTSVQISTMKNQKRLEAETLANEDIMKRIATAQSELLQKAISAWREEELKKINENPSAYIKMGKEESTQQS